MTLFVQGSLPGNPEDRKMGCALCLKVKVVKVACWCAHNGGHSKGSGYSSS